MATITLVHAHSATQGDVLMTVTELQDPAHWVDALNEVAQPGEWAAVPPAGSDWEAADWDALAHRFGVA